MYKGRYVYKNKELKAREVLNLENDVVYTAVYDYSISLDGNILVIEKEYDSKENLLGHSLNLQNEKNQDLTWIEFNRLGRIAFINDMTYNNKGNVIEYIRRDSTNNIKWKWHKTLNLKGSYTIHH